MKKTIANLSIIMSLFFLLNSCSTSELTVSKRRYSKGFYVDFNNINIKKTDKLVEPNLKTNIEDFTNNEKTEISSNTLTVSTDDDIQNIVKDDNEISKPIFESKTIDKKQSKIQKKLKRKEIKSITNGEPDEEGTKTLSLVSFVLGLVGLFIPFVSFAALVLGIIALNKYKQLDGFSDYKWMAITGLVLGAVISFLTLIAIILWVAFLAIMF